MKEVGRIAQKIGKRLAPTWLLPFTDRQSVFFGNHFELLLDEKWIGTSCRLATAYFHGQPGTGSREFDLCFENLRKHHDRICRVQVSHTDMRDLVLSSGIDSKKVFLIPIGINPDYFIPQTPELRRRAREKYGITQDSVVIGSFQKDGVGWGDGMEPKLVKGPDVLVNALSILKSKIPDLFVLLSGPARGYVKAGLEKHGIPYRHYLLKEYPEINSLYHCLDLYLVTSREEGGPKSVLESMASGVPLVTTCVGQAMDIVRHGENGWMVKSGDVDGLVSCAEYVMSHPAQREKVVTAGLLTAAENTYNAQMPLWSKFFEGFVE
jgi:glycosyltransferase involved in cell wall biosynthesis